MPSSGRKVKIIFFVIATLLLVGLLPLVLTGWFLSDKSGRELRASENRYQIQLVQEKALQIEMFGRKYESVVQGLVTGFELNSDPNSILSAATEQRLSDLLRADNDLLALYVKPAQGEPLVIFRPGRFTRAELDDIANNVPQTQPNKVVAAQPQEQGNPRAGMMTFSADATVNGSVSARVLAVASLKSISQAVVGLGAVRETDLWSSGLPIVFVSDEKGRTIFHPDATVSEQQRSMAGLKIVEEWLESGEQVQSALVPFTAEFDGHKYDMIGAYSTASLTESQRFGVFTMQDEAKALASVGEMRNQVWLISLAFALLALLVGVAASRLMTNPLTKLVEAAKNISGGNYSEKVPHATITELDDLSETFNVMSGKIEDQIVNLANAAAENRELFEGTVKALAAAIDGKDKYTRGHSERVARISVAIGKRLDLPAEELETLRMSALLHDIGKIAIDDAILKKPAALTDEEYEIMKTHPQRGYKIMSQIPAMKDFLPGMYMHHEMVNGQGYPQGLKGDEIPMQAKIVSVADTFDAMTIDRPYSKGMDLASALERLRSFVGTRYQHEVVEALVQACDAGEVANGIVRQMEVKRSAQRDVEAQAIQIPTAAMPNDNDLSQNIPQIVPPAAADSIAIPKPFDLMG